MERALHHGRFLVLPSKHGYRRQFGSWPRALFAGGFISLEDVARRTRRSRYSDEELCAALARTIAVYGPSLTCRQYSAWRRRQIEELSLDELHLHVPSDALLIIRLGSGDWEAAKRRAIEWASASAAPLKAAEPPERSAAAIRIGVKTSARRHEQAHRPNPRRSNTDGLGAR